MERRGAATSPIYFPDWLISSTLSRDMRDLLTRYAYGRLLDVGCGRTPYREMISEQIESYTALDIAPAPEVDVVGDALNLPFENDAFQTVFTSQVLEHVTDPRRMLAELARVVTPDGYVILSVPQYWPEHEVPYDFHRFTIHGLQSLGTGVGLEMIHSCRQGGGFAVAGQAINNVLAERIHFGDPSFSKLSKILRAALLCPIFLLANVTFGVLDRLLPSRDDTLGLGVVYRRLS